MRETDRCMIRPVNEYRAWEPYCRDEAARADSELARNEATAMRSKSKKRIKARPGTSFRGFELLFPSCRKILNLLESQDLWFAFSDDRRAHALLKRQHHRPCYRRTQFHGAVIGQRNGLFRVESHFTR